MTRLRLRWSLILACCSIPVVLTALAWRYWLSPLDRSRVPDPRLTYDTPFLNVRPEVAYVGDAACASCHPAHYESYKRHPMGQSLFAAGQEQPCERWEETARPSFRVDHLLFQVQQVASGVRHRQVLAADNSVFREEQVAYVLGSGSRGRSYIVQRGDALFQSPISWYTEKQRWDLSPGYYEAQRHFERPVAAECLFCHSHEARPVAHSVNRYEEPIFRGLAIGCERCHGPGELHVRYHTNGGPVRDVDDTIVNPRHLAPVLRDAVCEQCHLPGERRIVRRGRAVFDYRPGLPLHLFWSVFVRAPEYLDARKAVSHVEQLHQSRCYRASLGKMSCTSCHDAHEPAPLAGKVQYYRERCLACHVTTDSCGLPASSRPGNDCIACHMPRRDMVNVAHTAITDHRIARRPQEAGQKRPPIPSGPEALIVHFHREHAGAEDLPEIERDLGIALSELSRLVPGTSAAWSLARAALPKLESALARDSQDIPAREALAYAYWVTGQEQRALACYREVLRQAPARESALEEAASLALTRGEARLAQRWLTELVRLNPHFARHHAELARTWALVGDWSQALGCLHQAVHLSPLDPSLRRLAIVCAAGAGDEKTLQEHFRILIALQPQRHTEYAAWLTRARSAPTRALDEWSP